MFQKLDVEGFLQVLLNRLKYFVSTARASSLSLVAWSLAQIGGSLSCSPGPRPHHPISQVSCVSKNLLVADRMADSDNILCAVAPSMNAFASRLS